MSLNEASSVKVEESEVSDDPWVHDSSCHYFQYKQVHSKGLRSEEQVKQRLKDDLLRRRGRTQPAVVAQIEKEVEENVSEFGTIHQYLKTKRALYDSYKPLMKSFCYCESAKISKLGQPMKGEEMMFAPERHFAVDEVRQPRHGRLPVDQSQEGSSQRSVAVEHVQSRHEEKNVSDNLAKKEDVVLGNQATLPDDSAIAPLPNEIPASTFGRHVYSQLQLDSLMEVGLDLSEDDSDEEPEAAAVDVLPPTEVNNLMTESVDTELNSNAHESENINSYLETNPHDELDYGEDGTINDT